MTQRPTREQIELAHQWLYVNEGNNGEAADCRAVADWILAMDDDYRLRLRARGAGVPVSRLRRALAEAKL